MKKLIFAFIGVTLATLSLLILFLEETTVLHVTVAVVAFLMGVFSMYLSTEID